MDLRIPPEHNTPMPELSDFLKGKWEEMKYYATYIIGNSTDAEDIVGDVNFSILKKGRKFKCKEEADDYLFISVKRRCIKFLMKKKASRKNYQEYTRTISTTTEDDLQTLHSFDESLQQIKSELKNFSDKDQELMDLFYFQNKNMAEVAQLTNQKVTSAYTQKSKTLKRLKLRVLKLLKVRLLPLLIMNLLHF